MCSREVEIPVLEYRPLKWYVKSRYVGFRRVREKYALSVDKLVYYPYYYGEYTVEAKSRFGRCRKISLRVMVDALTNKGGISAALPPVRNTRVLSERVLPPENLIDCQRACDSVFSLTLRDTMIPLAFARVLSSTSRLVYYPLYILEPRTDDGHRLPDVVDAITHTLMARFVSLPYIVAHLGKTD